MSLKNVKEALNANTDDMSMMMMDLRNLSNLWWFESVQHVRTVEMMTQHDFPIENWDVEVNKWASEEI